MAAEFGHVIGNVNRSEEARGNDCKRLCSGKRGVRERQKQKVEGRMHLHELRREGEGPPEFFSIQFPVLIHTIATGSPSGAKQDFSQNKCFLPSSLDSRQVS